jgi:hypothetical protein
MNRASDQTRRVNQQEQIGRRESIIDARRDTRAPAFQPQQDLRSARRGDVGGADALLRTLGLVENAGSEIQKYMTNKTVDAEQDNMARGAVDQAAGTVDEAMMDKSLGYRNAVTKGRTVSNFADASREFDDELKQLIEGQTSPILEERLAEINQTIEGFYTGFAQDPETGELRDYLQSPGAMRYLAEAIQTSRPRAQAAAQQLVEEGFKREAFGHFGKNVVSQAIETGTVDLTAARSLLPDIVTDEEFAENAFMAVTNASRALEEQGRFTEAAGLLAGLRQRTRTPVATGVGQSAPTGTPEAGNINATGTAGQFATALKGAGLSDAVVAGFLGNIQHESSFDSSRVGDSGSAFGHVQWRADRVENFKRVVGVHPRGATPEQSVQFIKWELDNYRAAGMTKNQRDAILNAETPEEAARAIDRFYERSDQKSTRDRMAAARKFFGTAPAAAAPAAEAAPAAPALRLRDPFADPVTQLERSGEMVEIVGIEDVQFTPEQVARMDELYAASTDRMRRAYRTRQAEEQSLNGTQLALGLAGIGGAVTTRDDIIREFEAGNIGVDDVQSLIQMQERQADRRTADADREESRAERLENKERERKAREGSEVILGALFTGRLTAPEARRSALLVSSRLSDPQVAGSILSDVNAVANAIESAVENSDVVRKQQATLREAGEDPAGRLQTLDPTLNPARARALAPQYQALVERAGGRFVSDIAKGVDPETAALNSQAYLIEEEAKLLRTLRTPSGAGGPATGR